MNATIYLGERPRVALSDGRVIKVSKYRLSVDMDRAFHEMETWGVTQIELRGFVRFLRAAYDVWASQRFPRNYAYIELNDAKTCLVLGRTPNAAENLIDFVARLEEKLRAKEDGRKPKEKP